MNFRKVKVRRDTDCNLCGENPTIDKLIIYEEACDIQAARSEGR